LRFNYTHKEKTDDYMSIVEINKIIYYLGNQLLSKIR